MPRPTSSDAARFDRVVVVDWSSSATPRRGADSIWFCVADVATGRCSEPVNMSTRHACESALLELLAGPGRTLVGFDFPFGFPAGTAARLAMPEPAWHSMWTHLAGAMSDDPRNRNNRWQVAAALNARLGANQFWGVPAARASASLTVRRPPPDERPMCEFRVAEQRLRDRGLRPFPVWQLLGAGSVGSQTLTGIPVLHRLRHHPLLAHRSAVRPFETGLTVDTDLDDAVVFAEVWPSSIGVDHVDHPVKDARQVTALALHLADLDRRGDLAPAFAPNLPDDDRVRVVDEEGWVLLVD